MTFGENNIDKRKLRSHRDSSMAFGAAFAKAVATGRPIRRAWWASPASLAVDSYGHLVRSPEYNNWSGAFLPTADDATAEDWELV